MYFVRARDGDKDILTVNSVRLHTFRNHRIPFVNSRDQLWRIFSIAARPRRTAAQAEMAFSLLANEWTACDCRLSVSVVCDTETLHLSECAFSFGSCWSCNFRAGLRPNSHDSCSGLFANPPRLLCFALFSVSEHTIQKKKALCDVAKVHDIFCRFAYSQVFVLSTSQPVSTGRGTTDWHRL